MELACSATIRCARSRYLSRSACCVMNWRWGSTPSSFVNLVMCWINTASLLYCSFEYPVSCGESFGRRFPLSPSWPENSMFGVGVCDVGSLFERDWRTGWEGARLRSVPLAIVNLVSYSSRWSIAPGKCRSCERGIAAEVKVGICVGHPVGRSVG